MKYLSNDKAVKIMDEFSAVFKFRKTHVDEKMWFDFSNKKYIGYKLPEKFLENDRYYEKINTLVNSIVKEDMFVIDWNHSVRIKEKNEKVNYFPNGDDYFFVTKNYDYAILTLFISEKEHYIFFVGEKLVNEVVKLSLELELIALK